MKTIVWFIFVATIIGLVFFFIQHITISNKISRLEVLNKEITKKEIVVMEVLQHIVDINLDPARIQEEYTSNPEELYLYVDFPVCSNCFIEVTHFLYEYSKNKEKTLIILCSSKYTKQIKKVLRFEEVGAIEVKDMLDANKMPTKMMISFNSKEGANFYLPLPEKQEIDFLESFLKIQTENDNL